MPIAILRVSAVGNYDEATLGAGANKVVAVDSGDPVTHDDNTTYLQYGNDADQNRRQSYTLTAMPGAATGVRQVNGRVRWRPSGSAGFGPGTQNVRISARLNSVDGTGKDSVSRALDAGYFTEDGGELDDIARPNGGNWTLADLADASFEIIAQKFQNRGTPGMRVTTLWFEVDHIVSAILPYDVQTGSFRVVFFSSEVALYQVKVHHKFLANENVIDLMNIADSSFPVAPSILEDLTEHGLLDKWRRKVVIPVGQRYLPSEHAVEFTLLDYEPIMATYFSTLVSPFGNPGDALDGVARFGPGAVWTVDRASEAFVERESTIVQNADNSEGAYLRVPDGREKINHNGLLAEDAATNLVLNSAFALGTFTNWTNVLNGGSFSANTQKTAFPDAVTLQSFDVSRANDSNDSYTEQSIAVLLADAFRRVSFIHSEDDTTSIASIAIQRDFDSRWWNDGTATWQVSKVFLNAANSFDSVNSLEKELRVFTKPIPVDQNENWLIQVGMEGASLPAGGGDVRIYHVQSTVGKLRYSPIPTEGVAVTTSADSISGSLFSIPVRQMHYAGRGTISFEMLAEQDGGDLEDGDEHVLVHVEYGSTPGDDYDTVLYQKLAGQNVRFSFERFISGVLDVRATKDVVIVRGTVYRIRAMATSDSDGELGLAARTMRITIDEVAGTDATASATHSTLELITDIWIGSAPSAVGYLTAMNVIRRLRLQPRVVPLDEKIL